MDTEDAQHRKQAGECCCLQENWGKPLQVLFPDPMSEQISTLRSQSVSGAEEKADCTELQCSAQCCSPCRAVQAVQGMWGRRGF